VSQKIGLVDSRLLNLFSSNKLDQDILHIMVTTCSPVAIQLIRNSSAKMIRATDLIVGVHIEVLKAILYQLVAP
jgi:hypothetical protein